MHPTSLIVRWTSAGLKAVLFACCLVALPARVEGVEVKLRAQLIWGTNDARPEDGDCKEVSGKLREKLARVFKWKNYFEVKDQRFAVKPGEPQRVKMSKKCELEVKLVDDFTVELQLYGEGTLMKTLRQPLQGLRQGETAVLAGDAKEKLGDAWFVVLTMPKE